MEPGSGSTSRGVKRVRLTERIQKGGETLEGRFVRLDGRQKVRRKAWKEKGKESPTGKSRPPKKEKGQMSFLDQRT